jgi:hypothetical protein
MKTDKKIQDDAQSLQTVVSGGAIKSNRINTQKISQ